MRLTVLFREGVSREGWNRDDKTESGGVHRNRDRCGQHGGLLVSRCCCNRVERLNQTNDGTEKAEKSCNVGNRLKAWCTLGDLWNNLKSCLFDG